jgi:uncharacterized protein
MTEKLIHSLLSPSCYPHETGKLGVIETHISWVILTGAFVYKIKKPVNFGFLDFSTLAKRKHFCEEELRLNSRFSNALYLEVVAICGSEDAPKIVEARTTNESDSLLEYAVKMREFDQQGLLVTLVAENKLGFADINALGKKLAAFHNTLAARLPPDNQEFGSVQSINSAALENFQQIMPVLTSEQACHELAALRSWTEQQLGMLQSVFNRRRADGFVRECHGDLHLGNIVRIADEITFFDCIEFNTQFRWIDIQSELAFILMDLEVKQLPGLSNQLLNTWLEYSGDYAGLATLRFYKVYRALVRAKVALLKTKGATLCSKEAERAWQDYTAYH